MLSNVPDITQDGFLKLIFDIISKIAENPHLGGSIPCAVHPGDPPEQIRPFPRLVVQLEGSQRFTTSIAGQRADIVLQPGQCVYWTANAWMQEYWDAPSRFFGMVMQSDCLRLIQVLIGPDVPRFERTPWAYETALPLDGAGLLVTRALDRLAEEGDPGGSARDLLVALLRLGRQHLLHDHGSSTHRRAQLTWRSVKQYLEENYARPITRESAAASLGLHPNYLSTLARQTAGTSFRHMLETIRMNHAQRLLRSTDLKLLRIASLCGYSDAANFIKAFRRIVGVTPGRFRETGAL